LPSLVALLVARLICAELALEEALAGSKMGVGGSCLPYKLRHGLPLLPRSSAASFAVRRRALAVLWPW